MRIILGIIGIVVGFIIVWKSEWMLRAFGRVPWAEAHLGFEGGSRLFYKLIGVLVIIIGAFAATNLLGGILNAILSPLFGGFTATE
ncbi:hypothetical protein HYT45_00335 [Candidatus Uhrbacteria bacterium]|nr:hypothetical protein [Candidatus Uhrbacteria bacterium]